MPVERNAYEMKCPKCGRYSLRQKEGVVTCATCGYRLPPGQEARFRLFELLRKEERGGSVKSQ